MGYWVALFATLAAGLALEARTTSLDQLIKNKRRTTSDAYKKKLIEQSSLVNAGGNPSGRRGGIPPYIQPMKYYKQISDRNFRVHKTAVAQMLKEIERAYPEVIEEPEMELTTISRFVTKMQRTNNQDRKRLTDAVSRKFTGIMELVAEQDNALDEDEKVSEDLQDEVEADTDTTVQEMEQATDENINKYAENMQRGMDYLEDTKQDSIEDLESYKGEQLEETDDLADSVKSTQKEEMERYKEVKAVEKEINALRKDVTKQMDKTEELTSEETAHSLSEAGLFKGKFETIKATQHLMIKKFTDKVVSVLNRELSRSHSDVTKEQSRIVKKTYEKATELAQSMGALAESISAARLVAQRSELQGMQQSILEQSVAQTALESVISRSDHLRGIVEDKGNNLESELEKTSSELKQVHAANVGTSDTKRNDMLRKVEFAIDAAKKRVEEKLAFISRDTQGMTLNKVSEASTGVQLGANEVMGMKQELGGLVTRLNALAVSQQTEQSTMEAEMGRIQKNIKSTVAAAFARIKETRESTRAKFAEDEAEYKETSTSADAKLAVTYNDERAKMLPIEKTLRTHLEGLSRNYADDLGRKVNASFTTIKQGELRSQIILDDVNKASTHTERELAHVVEALPVSHKELEEELSVIKEKHDEDTTKLDDARAKVLDDTNAKVDKIEKAATERFSQNKVDAAAGVAAHAKHAAEVTDEMTKSIFNLQAETAQDFAEHDKELGKIKSKIEETAGKTVILQDLHRRQAAQLHGAISEDRIKRAKTLRAEKVSTQNWEDEMTGEAAALFKTGDAKAVAMLDRIAQGIQGTLLQHDETANKVVAGDRAKLDTYQAEAEKEFENMNGDVLGIERTIDAASASIETQNNAQNSKLASISEQSEKQQGRIKKQLSSLSADWDQKVDHLSIKVDSALSKMVIKQMAKATDMEAEQKQKFADEARYDTDAQKRMSGIMASWGGRVNGEVAGLGATSAQTRAAMHGFEAEERSAEAKLVQEVGGLGQEAQVGEQRIEGAIRDEESHASDGMKQELDKMGGTFSGLKNSQKEAAMAVKNAKTEMGVQLTTFQAKADADAKSLEAELAQFGENTVHLAAQFDGETKHVRDRLSNEEKRVGAAIDVQQEQAKHLRDSMYGVRKKRIDTVKTIHGQTTAVKHKLLDQLTLDAQDLASTKKLSTDTLKDLARDADAYAKKMDHISGFEANHDEALVEEMRSKSNKLMGTNEKLVTWQTMFKHRTLAWRNEVARRLGQMGRKIEHEESWIADDQLDGELSQNKKLRAMQKMMDADVTAAAQHENGMMNGLVGSIGSQMSHLMKEQGTESASEANEMNRAQDAVRNSGAAGSQDKNSAQSAGQLLAERSKDLVAQMHAQNAHMNSEGAIYDSSRDPRFDEGIKALQGKISKMSLVELGQSGDASVAALKSLRDELKRENSQLAHEDSMLDARADKIGHALQVKGLVTAL